MLMPRRFDAAGRRAFLDEVRPRFVLLRVRTDSAKITWGMPLWAAEEIVAFLLGAAAVAKTVMPILPRAWRVRLGRGITVAGRRVDIGLNADDADGAEDAADADYAEGNATSGALAELYRTIDSFAGGSLRDVLRVPIGEPYVKVQTDDTLIEIAAH